MKIFRSIILISLLGCAGTDLVEDNLTALEIIIPTDVIESNGNFAKLVGQTADLGLTATSDLGGSFLFDDANWTSSNPDVAIIDDNGTVTALQVGDTFISASAMGITSNVIMVSVTDDQNVVALVEVNSPDDIQIISPGEVLQLSARPLSVVGEQLPVEVAWESEDINVAIVNQDGLVSAIREGTVRIIASSGNARGFFELTVGTAMSFSRSGMFEGLNGYRTSGSVTLDANNDGSITLNLGNDFSAQNGPGLYLYLSNSSDGVAGGLEIAALRNTRGADSYDLPSNIELDDFAHVILYCKPFGVGFGTAELSN